MTIIRCARVATFALLVVLTSPVCADIGAALKAFAGGDFALAEKELRPDAENGNAQAQVLLGRIKRDPRNSAPDPAEAYAWFVRAAETGNVEGQYWAGIMAQRG